MATSYPGALDAFTNPLTSNGLNAPSHAGQHTDVNDAIEAVQAELGLLPKGSYATVVARLNNLLDKFAGGTIEDVVAWDNSFGNRGGTISAYDFTGRYLLQIAAEGTGPAINLYGSSDTVYPDKLRIDGAADIDFTDTLTVNGPVATLIGASNGNAISIGTTNFATTYATVNLTVPTSWNTYFIEWIWTMHVNDTSGSSGVASAIVYCEGYAGATASQGFYQLFEMSDLNATDNTNFSGILYRSGASGTGSIAFTIKGHRSGAPTCDASRINLVVRLTRQT